MEEIRYPEQLYMCGSLHKKGLSILSKIVLAYFLDMMQSKINYKLDEFLDMYSSNKPQLKKSLEELEDWGYLESYKIDSRNNSLSIKFNKSKYDE